MHGSQKGLGMELATSRGKMGIVEKSGPSFKCRLFKKCCFGTVGSTLEEQMWNFVSRRNGKSPENLLGYK